MSRCLALLLSVASTGALAAQQAAPPQRTFDSARGVFVEFDAMLADLAGADVIFIGEKHDDRNTHQLELAVLEGLARRRGDVIVSLEMFERDVQEPLGHFLMGHLLEDEFLKESRPWPRYRTDYKPLVDFAIDREWPVIAANVPRSVAAEVSKQGLDVLKSKSDAERKWFARELTCPTDDEYFRRFAEAMGDHSGTTGTTERYYYAQCLKDETMAESIAEGYAAGAIGGKRPVVVHFNGAFHSDFGTGTVERARRRLPGKRVMVVSVLPVEKIDVAAPETAERRRGDYLLYTVASPAK